MRGIKFRAWIRCGEWEKSGDAQKYEMCYDLAFEDFEPINDLLAGVENLMQYTGLHDKNGKEIYEGDAIKDEEDCKFSVVWGYHNCGFYLESAEDNEYNVEMVYVLNNKVEIIGNIYENPELLKGA